MCGSALQKPEFAHLDGTGREMEQRLNLRAPLPPCPPPILIDPSLSPERLEEVGWAASP